MRSIAALAALAAVGCAEKAIELKLQLLDDPEFDVSCVNTVQVILHDGSPDFFDLPTQCVAVDGATSFADIEDQIRGRFSIDMPDEMIAIELRALASTTPELCGTGVNIFYAGQEFIGQEQISLRIRPTLS